MDTEIQKNEKTSSLKYAREIRIFLKSVSVENYSILSSSLSLPLIMSQFRYPQIVLNQVRLKSQHSFQWTFLSLSLFMKPTLQIPIQKKWNLPESLLKVTQRERLWVIDSLSPFLLVLFVKYTLDLVNFRPDIVMISSVLDQIILPQVTIKLQK